MNTYCKKPKAKRFAIDVNGQQFAVSLCLACAKIMYKDKSFEVED